MKISLIAAVARNGVIGEGGDLPWRLPADMKWFREHTLGHHVLMGRRTWESFGGVLPGRTNIVVSRSAPDLPEEVRLVGSVDEGLDLARRAGEEELFVVGGAGLYVQTFPDADRVYLTRVHASFSGDTWFPAVDLDGWRRIFEEDHPADERHAHAFTFHIYEKPSRLQDRM